MRTDIMKEKGLDKKLFIRQLIKVFKGKRPNQYFWFDIQKFNQLSSGLSNADLISKIELVEEDDTKIPSAKTVGRVSGFIAGDQEREDGKFRDKSISMETFQALGKALCHGDPYGLLMEVTHENIFKIADVGKEIWGLGDLDYIYTMMNNLLYELESSSYYANIPDTDKDGFDYYGTSLQLIRREIDGRFREQEATRDKLYRLVKEMESLIRSYDFPGAPDRWVDANPKLKYFDCVFDIMDEDPELYASVKQGDFKMTNQQTIQFSFYPTEEEVQARQAYFAQLIADNDAENTQYTIDRFYQNELVEAFRKVFTEDFADRDA